MLRCSTLILVIGVTVTACSAQAAPVTEAEVQEFVRQYVAAANAGDASKIMSMISKDAGTTSVAYGEVFRGWEEIRKYVDSNISAAAITKLTVATVAVQALGPEVALAVAPFTLTVNEQRRVVQLPGAASVVVRRMGGSLSLVHEHYSLKVQ